MKKITILFLLLLTLRTFAQVNWMSLEETIAVQKIHPKKMMIYFYSETSSPCKKMERETFNHPIISKYLNDNYYAVRFNVESPEKLQVFGRTFNNEDSKHTNESSFNEFTKFMNVSTVPSTALLDETDQPITILQGELTAKEIEPYLLFIGNNEYKKVESNAKWQNYQKKFKSKIKE